MWKACILFALAGAIAIPAAAQKPDFSGTWKLNVTKSSMGADHPDKDYQLTKIIAEEASLIRQTDIAAHVSMMNIPLPDSRVSTELVPDGKEHEASGRIVFPGTPPVKIRSQAEWQGGTLLVTESSVSFFGPSTTQRRYFLSRDGSQLIELIRGQNKFMDIEQRLVFERQP